MPGLIRIVLLVVVVGAAMAESPQPPQLLGVWYGTYETGEGDDAATAELWMEISWQKSKDGWDVAGHNRWNVMQSGDDAHGGDSQGRQAEHFDQVSGRIAADGQSVVFHESSRGHRIEADLTGPDSMQATFHRQGADEPAFGVELDRIDTHYEPGAVNVLGLDVSHHSGDIDWEKVKAQNYRFAYVKSSEGVDNPDARFSEHWQALEEVGLARGAYHFYVTEDDPVEQAKFFASRLADDPGDLPPAVDIEVLGANTDGDMTATLKTFLETLERETGVRPMIYTHAKFWDEYYEPAFADYHLWMAEYGVKMPKTPFGWDSWVLWQHAGDRAVDGVEKGADINFLHPSLELEALILKADAGS